MAIVIAALELTDIFLKVLRRHMDVRAADAVLQVRPETLNRVGAELHV